MVDNLYQKISAIIDATGAIPKDSNAPATMGGYAFTSHGALLSHLRRELTKRNVVIRPSGEELLKTEAFEKKTVTTDQSGRTFEKVSFNFHSIVKYKFTVVNGDEPSDFFEDYWIGEGMDTNDKGIQKAGTSAEKYYLMKLFKIGDKDDPDAVDPVGGGAVSDSATINRAGQPGAVSFAAAGMPNPTRTTASQIAQNAEPTRLEKLVAEAAPIPNGAGDFKKQQDTLIWLGEQLPTEMQWFRAKIVALVQLYDTKKKNGKLTPEETEAGTGVNHIFNQLVLAHKEHCGKADCEHVNTAALALRSNGTISDPAKT